MKLSILVPIYNKEKYLKLCLETLVNQSYKNAEIILIDDGSTDSSSKIINEYQKKYRNVLSISHHNIGYGASLNKAIKKAKGDFIAIVEPDDFVHKDLFKTLMANQKEHDIIKCNYFSFQDKNWITKPEYVFEYLKELGEINIKDNPEILLTDPTIWTAVYRKTMLEKNNIKFAETKGASFQDISFQLKAFLCAKNIYCIDKNLYYYRKGNNSSSSKSTDNIFSVKTEYDEVNKFIKSNKINVDMNYVNARRFKSYWWNYNRLKNKEVKEFAKVAKKDFKVLKFEVSSFKKFKMPLRHELVVSTKHPVLYLYLKPLFILKNKCVALMSRIFHRQ